MITPIVIATVVGIVALAVVIMNRVDKSLAKVESPEAIAKKIADTREWHEVCADRSFVAELPGDHPIRKALNRLDYVGIEDRVTLHKEVWAVVRATRLAVIATAKRDTIELIDHLKMRIAEHKDIETV